MTPEQARRYSEAMQKVSVPTSTETPQVGTARPLTHPGASPSTPDPLLLASLEGLSSKDRALFAPLLAKPAGKEGSAVIASMRKTAADQAAAHPALTVGDALDLDPAEATAAGLPETAATLNGVRSRLGGPAAVASAGSRSRASPTVSAG